jgi:hypothetical protein
VPRMLLSDNQAEGAMSEWERDDQRQEYAEELYEERRATRLRGCLCGYPDWPGQCPGAAFCPVHGEFDEEVERDREQE